MQSATKAGAVFEQFYNLPIDLCCVISTENQEIIHANAAFESTLGWKPDEVIGKPLTTISSDDDSVASIEKIFSKLSHGLSSISFETRCNSKNGQQRWVGWKGFVDPSTNLLYVIGRDVTQYKMQEKQLVDQSTMDSFTGLHSKQSFYLLLEKELNAAVRYQYSTAILIISVDHFKSFTLEHGVDRADKCIKQVAIALKASLRRKTDFLARFGDASFVVLLTHNDTDKAAKVAEYLRDNLEKLKLSGQALENELRITVSIGVTAISSTDKNITADTMINTALRALSMSKQRGGNQFSCA